MALVGRLFYISLIETFSFPSSFYLLVSTIPLLQFLFGISTDCNETCYRARDALVFVVCSFLSSALLKLLQIRAATLLVFLIQRILQNITDERLLVWRWLIALAFNISMENLILRYGKKFENQLQAQLYCCTILLQLVPYKFLFFFSNFSLTWIGIMRNGATFDRTCFLYLTQFHKYSR